MLCSCCRLEKDLWRLDTGKRLICLLVVLSKLVLLTKLKSFLEDWNQSSIFFFSLRELEIERKWSFISPQPLLHPPFHEISSLRKHCKPGIVFFYEVVKISQVDWRQKIPKWLGFWPKGWTVEALDVGKVFSEKLKTNWRSESWSGSSCSQTLAMPGACETQSCSCLNCRSMTMCKCSISWTQCLTLLTHFSLDESRKRQNWSQDLFGALLM